MKGLFLLLLCTVLSFSCLFAQGDTIEELTVNVPVMTEYSFSVFTRNFLYCHVIPFWIFAIFQVLRDPFVYTPLNAVKIFVMFYLRDLVIVELLNLLLKEFLPDAFLFENKSFFMSKTRYFWDYDVVFYEDPFVAAKQKGNPAPSFMYLRTLYPRLILAVLQMRALRLLSVVGLGLYSLPYLVIGLVSLLGSGISACFINFYISAIYSFHCLATVKRAFGKPSIFDPYYPSYAGLMALAPKARLEALEEERTSRMSTKELEQFKKNKELKEINNEKFKTCRRKARKIHRKALKQIEEAKKKKEEEAARAQKNGESPKKEEEKTPEEETSTRPADQILAEKSKKELEKESKEETVDVKAEPKKPAAKEEESEDDFAVKKPK